MGTNKIRPIKYVGPLYCPAKMYAGHVAYCHLLSHGEYANSRDRYTDSGQTPDCYITLSTTCAGHMWPAQKAEKKKIRVFGKKQPLEKYSTLFQENSMRLIEHMKHGMKYKPNIKYADEKNNQ